MRPCPTPIHPTSPRSPAWRSCFPATRSGTGSCGPPRSSSPSRRPALTAPATSPNGTPRKKTRTAQRGRREMSTKDFLEKDYYKALGVSKTAKPAEIKAEYRKLARKYHPDANKGDAKAEERFKE